MSQLEFATMSSRGQVVIPGDIRKQLGLEEGTRFMVYSDGVNLLMKPIVTPSAEAFKKMVRASQKHAKAAGLKKSDIAKAIKEVRKRARRA
jgi:AbrB family looped-hinge helix DNA binding protein